MLYPNFSYNKFTPSLYRFIKSIPLLKTQRCLPCFLGIQPCIEVLSLTDPAKTGGCSTKTTTQQQKQKISRIRTGGQTGVDHAAMDGYHMGLFFDRLQDNLNTITI